MSQSQETFWERWRGKIGDSLVLLIFAGVSTLVTMSWHQGQEINTLNDNQKSATILRAARASSIDDKIGLIRGINKVQSNKLNTLDQRVHKNGNAIGVLKTQVKNVEQKLNQRSR